MGGTPAKTSGQGLHPEVVQKDLEAEKDARRVMGPFAVGEIKAYISSLGVIPKKQKPGSWRLILDFSHPEGSSVNDGIRREKCSLTYLSLDDVALKSSDSDEAP